MEGSRFAPLPTDPRVLYGLELDDPVRRRWHSHTGFLNPDSGLRLFCPLFFF